MLKSGIFLDMENLVRNGGWGMRFDAIRELVVEQGTTVLRANAYMAVDTRREQEDPEFRERQQKYRERVRASGFHIVEKEVKRYRNEDGVVTTKANADLDMAVDAILQAENLDYILIGSGDGDFCRLVRALQNKGKRVDALAFDNVSGDLKREVDYFFPGTVVPGILPIRNDPEQKRMRGILDAVNAEKGFGFITTRSGYSVTDIQSGIFCHISQVSEDGEGIGNDRFHELSRRNAVLEFEPFESEKGVQAVNATVYQPSS